MKRHGSAVLVLFALLAALAAPVSAAAYTDTDGHWAASTIEKARQYGLMVGDGSGAFYPDTYLNRASFVTILCQMFGWDAVESASPSYLDCDAGHWAYGYVEAARQHDVTDRGGFFRPDDYITREEMAIMLVRALGYDTLAQDLGDLSLPFDDVERNQGYIAIAYDIGMITGVAGPDGSLKFLPTTSAKREEAAAMLVRVYERYTSRVEWLHGFYAFSSYSQIALAREMDAVSLGWARMEYTADGPTLNSTSSGGNEWVKPSDSTLATSYFEQNQVPYNLNVYASAADSITLSDGTTTSTVAAVVSTPQARTQAVNALVDAASDYAGLTIDFEALKGDTLKADYVTFMEELRTALPEDKTLYVCVQPDTWYTGFDYHGLGEVCDKVILMAHDYQWTSIPTSYLGTANTDSPVTPFPQIYEALRDITDPVTGVSDVSKVALAISFGTAGFHIDADGRLLDTTIYHPAQDTLTARLAQADTQVTYSEHYRNPYAIYTTEDGERYKVWYENEQSVLDKIELARMFGITGVSLWRLGNITAATGYDVWSAVESAR